MYKEKWNKTRLRILTIGGFSEVGQNCLAIEYGNDILIVDLGIGFPDYLYPGADKLLPNISYLQHNKRKIRGILITHGHADHIGGLKYLSRALGYPKIYGSSFTIEMIKEKILDSKSKSKIKLQIVPPGKKLIFPSFTARFITVTHSIPDARSLVIGTPKGHIFISGDFKFDDKPLNTPKTDYVGLAKVGSVRPILGIYDSTNSFSKGWSVSETEVQEVLYKLISRINGRVLVSTFSSEITRIHSLLEIARRLKRKVAILGRSIAVSVDVAVKTGYIKNERKVLINSSDIKKYKPREVMLIVTGTQGEENATLAKLAEDRYKSFRLNKADTVIMSSSVIPGNDLVISHLLCALVNKGVNVIHKKQFDVHTTGHAHQEEQLKMIKLTNPQYIMPGYADSIMKDQLRKTIVKDGFANSNILMTRNGYVWEFVNNNWILKNNNKIYPYKVEGNRILKRNENLYENRRRQLNNGLVVITKDRNNKFTINPINISSQRVEKVIIEEIKKTLATNIQTINKNNKMGIDDLIKSKTRYTVRKVSGKNPEVRIIKVN